MPREGRYELVQRLAAVLDVKPAKLAREVDERRLDPLTPIVVKTAVGEEQVDYLYEHQAEFPGVRIVQIYLRGYPYSSLAAQILGYTGEISPEELKRLRKSYRAGDRIGKAGIEAAYDSYLRGRPGLGQIRVDSLGRQVSPYVPRQESTPGYALRLTLDMKLQRAAEQALQYGIDLAHQNDQWAANGGAIVALDPRDGAVLALASAPTFKPSVFVGRTDPKKLEALYSDSRNPLFNRAIAGLYPPGSTWKPVTALAGMQEHVFSAYDSIQCTGSATYGLDKQVFRNWNPYVNRPMTLPEALAESCDTYFYEIGDRFYNGGSESRVRMQQWARRFGFGTTDGARHRRRGGRARADARVAQEDVQERLGSRVEPGRLDPARDRPEGPARHAAADGGVLRDARERRKCRHAVPRLRRRAVGSKGLAARRAATVRGRTASLRRRRPRGAAGLFETACTRRRTRRTARRPASSPTSPSRSRARRERRRRSFSSPATRPAISRTSRGGAAGGRPSRRGSSCAR